MSYGLPVFSKLNYTQFEILFPSVPIFDKYLSSLVSNENQHVIVEFPLFVKYVLENDVSEVSKKESKTFISISEDLTSSTFTKTTEKGNIVSMPYVTYNGIKEDARYVNSLLEGIVDFLKNVNIGFGKKTMNEVHDTLPKNLFGLFHRKVSNNTQAFKSLWQCFVINVGIMNIKSLILCAENNYKSIPDKALVPIRFIPKIGQELGIFFMSEKSLTLTEVKERLIEGRIENKYGEDVYFGSLSKSEEINFLDLEENMNIKPLYIQKFAEKFGYNHDRYIKAEEKIIFSASVGTSDLEDCKKFLDEHIDYIGTLGLLVGQLIELGKGSTCIVLDFHLN